MSSQRRLQIGLVVLLGILAVAMFRSCNSSGGGSAATPATSATSETTTVRRTATRPSTRSRRSQLVSVDIVEALSSLETTHVPSDYKAGRNPFAFYVPPPPPRPKPKPVVRPAPEPRPVDRGPIIPPAPQPPVFRLQYLGSFGPERMKIAVFTDGEAILNVSTGETIEEEFVVRNIGLETVSIGYVDFPEVPPKQVPIGQ